jgi:hypothetical protein
MKIDGVIRGLSDARTSVADFPKRFFGSREVTETLVSRNNSDRDVYEEMIPSTEARLMMYDGIQCGVAVGEMVPVEGRNFPVLVRRFPQNLYYIWSTNTWYYRSALGLIPITGRIGIPDANGSSWVLHIPGGRLAPWNSGLWNTTGRSYMNKTSTIFARQSYVDKHAMPARVMWSAQGANETERRSALQQLIQWARNAAFVLPPGWDMKVIQASGEAYQVYDKAIESANHEIATSLCGSAVMLQGTTGFTNLDVFRVVQKDLIKGTARPWDRTVNTQIIAPFVGLRWGVDALKNATSVETDIEAPKDRAAEANTMVTLANGIKGLVEAIKFAQQAGGVGSDGKQTPIYLDYKEILASFGIPWEKGGAPLELALAEANSDVRAAKTTLALVRLEDERRIMGARAASPDGLQYVATRYDNGLVSWMDRAA